MPDEIGTPAEGAASTSTTPEATGSSVDFGPVLSRVDELASTFDGRFAALEQRIPAPEQPQTPSPWDALFPDEPDEPQFAPDPYQQQVQQPQGLTPDALKTAFQQAVDQANAPLVQRLAGMQLERDMQQLYTDIPSLADKPENATVRAETAQRIQASLAHLPAEIQHTLGNDPKYIATVFKAAEAEKLAAGQTPATSDVPQLEAAGGATPGGGEQPNIAQQIYASRGAAMPGGFGR